MPHELVLLLVGLFYALVFRLLALLRREEFSLQFILESVVLTLLAMAVSFLARIRLNPIVLVLVLYLVTMRARLLVDLANLMARSGRFPLAERIYGLAWRLRPDEPGRLVIGMNEGAILIMAGRPSEAIPLLEKVLEAPNLSPKYDAATNYNLGLAYHRTGQGQKAIKHLSAAIEILPGSIYATGARTLLRKQAKGEEPPGDEESAS